MTNQNPEQIAQDTIIILLKEAGRNKQSGNKTVHLLKQENK